MRRVLLYCYLKLYSKTYQQVVLSEEEDRKVARFLARVRELGRRKL